jgi:hypothetical protein
MYKHTGSAAARRAITGARWAANDAKKPLIIARSPAAMVGSPLSARPAHLRAELGDLCAAAGGLGGSVRRGCLGRSGPWS